jgi:putative SbcD/Mre11-related phosphoesterase
MNFSDLQPVTNHPALFIKKEKTLILADLHIGIEKQLNELGVNAYSQTNLMMDQLVSLCKKHNPKKIFILGDIKHNIPLSTFKEKKDVKDFLDNLLSFCEINIIPGNHDGNIRKMTPKEVFIHPSNGFIFKNIGLVHGHRWPSSEVMLSRYILIAHTHPTIMLEDRLGYKSFKPCWLKGEITKKSLNKKYPDSTNIKFIVIPAFNPLCGGIAVNVDGFTGPLGNIIDIKKSEVFLLDGSSLGKIQDIKKI